MKSTDLQTLVKLYGAAKASGSKRAAKLEAEILRRIGDIEAAFLAAVALVI
jgi:hypothetical protein